MCLLRRRSRLTAGHHPGAFRWGSGSTISTIFIAPEAVLTLEGGYPGRLLYRSSAFCWILSASLMPIPGSALTKESQSSRVPFPVQNLLNVSSKRVLISAIVDANFLLSSCVTVIGGNSFSLVGFDHCVSASFCSGSS